MAESAEDVRLTPTEELVMEVLAARYRLGEHLWPFSSDRHTSRAINNLETKGLVHKMSGQTERTVRASLTDAGKKLVLLDGYVSPNEKRWLRKSPADVHAFLDKLFEGEGFRPLYEPHDFDGIPGIIGGNCRTCGGPIVEPWHNR